ncbi:MAG TPA: hypothetical protein V6D29_00335 [Leptolyngbyaceae cyanobacterium]
MTDFSILLKEEPEAAIASRLDYLEEKAKAARLDIESAKLSSLTLTLVGFGLSANPLVALIGGIGALGYVGSLVTDYLATGRFCPVPALRKGVGELLSGFSGHGDDADPDVAEVEALASCLPPREAKEFWLLSRNSDRLLGHILPVAPEQRLSAYGLAVRNPRVLGTVNPALPALSSPAQALPPATSEADVGTVGPNTRLGAISVPAVPAEPTAASQAVHEDESPIRTAIPRGVLTLRPETHLKLLAPSRGGKTNTLLHLLKDVQNVTYLTLKDSDRIPPHWQGYRLRPYNIHADVAAVLSEIQPVVADILNGRSRVTHWLVLDEALAVTDLLESQAETDEDRQVRKQFSSLIKLLLATGAAQGAMLALMSQTQNGSDIKGVSAASLQNLWSVICGSERCADGFSHMAGWYTKHVDTLTGQQVAELKKLNQGFYQLAAVRGEPLLCSFPQFEGDLKPCVVPGRLSYPQPTARNNEASYGTLPQSHQQRLENALQQPSGESVEDKVVAYLEKQLGFVPTYQIRNNVRLLKEMSLEEGKALLNRMVQEGMIGMILEGSTEKYGQLS